MYNILYSKTGFEQYLGINLVSLIDGYYNITFIYCEERSVGLSIITPTTTLYDAKFNLFVKRLSHVSVPELNPKEVLQVRLS